MTVMVLKRTKEWKQKAHVINIFLYSTKQGHCFIIFIIMDSKILVEVNFLLN